jgi:cellulose synthase operon protein B
METQTARGVTSLPLMYRIKRIPDLAFPGKAKIKLITNYSYASQLDNSQSKLEVRLNGKAIASFALDKPEGETNASRAIEFPVEDFFSYNELEYQFFTYPPKKNACEFVTDAQIWGTVHNTSRFEFTNEKRSSLPDAGLLNDGGFPFSEVADFSETAIVMPASPNTAEQNTLLQLMLRLGKEAAFSGKKLPVVVTPEGLTAELKSNKHIIVIGQSAVNALKGDIKSKVQLVLEGKTADFSEQEKTLATLSHDSNQGVVEEVLSPWNEKRVVLLAYGETPTAQQNVADLFKKDGSFQAIQEGNITVINSAGEVRSLTALKRGDARLVYSQQKEGMHLPSWVVFTLGFLGLVGLFTILGSLFAGRKK